MNAVFAADCRVGHFFLLPCDLQRFKLNFMLSYSDWCQIFFHPYIICPSNHPFIYYQSIHQAMQPSIYPSINYPSMFVLFKPSIHPNILVSMHPAFHPSILASVIPSIHRYKVQLSHERSPPSQQHWGPLFCFINAPINFSLPLFDRVSAVWLRGYLGTYPTPHASSPFSAHSSLFLPCSNICSPSHLFLPLSTVPRR